MALVCPACGTENRSVAKFCIECIGALPVGFEATQLAPRPAPRESSVPEGMPSALAAFAAPPSPRTSPASLPPQDRAAAAALPPPETRGRKGLWVSVGALAIALIVGAAGWAAAGAGGWYIYRDKATGEVATHEPATPPPTDAAAGTTRALAIPAPTASASPALASSVHTLSAPASSSAASTFPASESASPPTVASTLAPGEVLLAGSAKSAPEAPRDAEAQSPIPAAPGTAPARIAHKPRAAALPAPAAASSLANLCGGMNFISAARCKVAECAKPAFRQSAECRVVHAQQRLMEEKRNPTLSN